MSEHMSKLIDQFKDLFNAFQQQCYDIALEHGLFEGEVNFGNLLCMVHGELSEALEAHRLSNPPDKHCLNFSSIEVELADAIMRIMNIAQHFKYDVVGAMIMKNGYNQTRPFKHGKLY